MKFARAVFLIAGIYGLIGLVPPLFMENKIGVDYPPAIGHPEYYYGFLGVGIAWQVAFIIISRDPLRFRPLLPAVMIEKFSFALAAAVLFFQQRAPSLIFALGMVDFVWGVLFIVAWTRLGAKTYPPQFDSAMRAGWGDPKMDEYNDYDRHRPK